MESNRQSPGDLTTGIRIVASINLREPRNASYIIVNLPASFLFATHASHLNRYTDIKCNDCRPSGPDETSGYRETMLCSVPGATLVNARITACKMSDVNLPFLRSNRSLDGKSSSSVAAPFS